MSINNTISVIIPCYNSSDNIHETLKGVINQTHKVNKIFIIDDNSSDSHILREKLLYFENKYTKVDFEYFKNKKNLGPGFSRNFCWNLVKTKFVAFLDSDDIWHKDKLERQLQVFDKYPSLSLVSCSKNKIYKNKVSDFVKLTDILFSNFIPLSSVLIKSNINNRFSNNYYAEDFSLWLDMLIEGHKLYFMNEILCSENKANPNLHSLSKNLFKMTYFVQSTLFKIYKKKTNLLFIIMLSQIWELLKFLIRISQKIFR